MAAITAITLGTLGGACGRGEKAPDSSGVSDTTAYRGASTLMDTTAQIAALEKFIASYPESAFRGRSYRRLYDLKAAGDHAAAADFARRALRKEKQAEARSALHYVLFKHAMAYEPTATPEVVKTAMADKADLDYTIFNAMAWDMAERGIDLDLALRAADKSLAGAPDSLGQATVLDTKGWIYYRQGDHENAIATLRQANALSPEPYQEIEVHLAQALEAGGLKAEARDAYVAQLLTQENPEFRERVTLLTTELGGSPAEVLAEIDRQREEAATPAPNFTLRDYAGEEVSLSDFRGQVVLLNFWHPT